MAKIKKGTRLTCVPCGREVVVDACGMSAQTIWCCGKPMARRSKAVKLAVKKGAKKKR